jgi:TetR/AcrR family transcriptional repressor of mexAB-oprM operon
MKESSQEFCNEIMNYMEHNKHLPIKERLTIALQICLDFIEIHSQWLISIQAPTCEGRQSLMYQSPLYKFLHAAFFELLSESSTLANKASKDAAFMADALLASMNPELYLFMKRNRGYTKEEIKQKLVGLYIDPLFS